MLFIYDIKGLAMQKHLLIFFTILILSSSVFQYSFAKNNDATLTLIYNSATSQSDMKRLNTEFSKEFGTIQSFDILKKTNFYIYYYITDENYLQYDVTRQDLEVELGRDQTSNKSEGMIGSAKYEAFKRRNMLDGRFSSGARNVTATVIKKPYKGTMFLFNSYGTELIRVETNDFYKSESAALRNAIKTMRRAIKDEKEKMAIPQKYRCLFCEYNDLKTRQKEKVNHLAFIALQSQLNQLYGEITEAELPKGISPYANLYLSLEDFETLDHLFDTDAVIFDNQIGMRKLPGHLINELINQKAPDQLLFKVAAAYKKTDFEELDLNNHTPLWSAISLKNIELMQQLIDLGASVNQTTKINGINLSPLILSAQLGNVETTKFLIEHGANKKLTTPIGQSAWSTAMWIGQYDQANLLWPENFIDPNSNQEANNFLIQAVYFGERKKFNDLLNSGVPITARGHTGDNIAMSAVKGITTFAINNDSISPSSTKHRVDQSIYWQIIKDAQTAGIKDPIISTIDSNKQTLLFHAYPESNEEINEQHIELFNRLITAGINPNSIDINGQNAEEKYMESRLAYFDELYKTELKNINDQRRITAKEAQTKQDDALELALDAITKSKKSRTSSRARTQARRIEAINKSDDASTKAGILTQTSEFIRDTTDVDYQVNYDQLENEVTKAIRLQYSKELEQANKTAAMQKQELDEYIQSLKNEERKNAATRKTLLFNSQ